MSRYIDADKIEDWAVENYGVVIPEYYDIIDAVELTADVKPVVHAHWIERNNKSYLDGLFECSNCSEFNGWRATYCPDCGAVMDEDPS